MTSPASFGCPSKSFSDAGLVRWLVVISVVPSKVFRTSGKIIIVFSENWNKAVHLFGIAVVEAYENPATDREFVGILSAAMLKKVGRDEQDWGASSAG